MNMPYTGLTSNNENIHPLRLYNNPLLYPAAIGDIQTVRRLLNEYPDYIDQNQDWIDPYDMTLPIHVANASVIPLLVERGADLSAHDSRGRTVFDIARENGDTRKQNVLSKLIHNTSNLKKISVPRSVTDPVSLLPVPLRDAVFLRGDVKNGKTVHQVYHKNTLTRVSKSPITRRPFTPEHVLLLKKFFSDKQIQTYRSKYARALRENIKTTAKNLKSIEKNKSKPTTMDLKIMSNLRKQMRSSQNALNAMKRKSGRTRTSVKRK